MTKGMRATFCGRGKFVCYHKHHARCAKRDKPIFWMNNAKADGRSGIIPAAASNLHASVHAPISGYGVCECCAYLAAFHKAGHLPHIQAAGSQ